MSNNINKTNKEVRFIPVSVEVREADDKKLIGGYVVEWEKLSVELWGFREKVHKGAFTKSLQRNTVKALWNHNSDLVLGSTKNRTLKLWEDDRGLAFELDLPDTTAGKDALISVERGDVDGVSFGFSVTKDEWDHTDKDNVIRTLVEVDLHEISPTPFPAYEGHSAVGTRSAQDVYEAHANELQKDKLAEVQRNAEARNRQLEIKEKELSL